MNIKSDNIELFNKLLEITICKIEFGSKLYGIDTINSDTDIMCIYIPSYDELTNIFNTHHQIQFTIDNVDYIFTSINNFIKNTLNGDSTINFEIINSNEMKEKIPFLYENRYIFYNYNIIRSYLGMARRDLTKKVPDFNKQIKKIVHGVRAYYFVLNILSKEFDVNITNNDKLYNLILNIRKIDNYTEKKKIVNEYKSLISKLRDDLNSKLSNNKLNLPKTINIEDMSTIDGFLQKFSNKESNNYYNYIKNTHYDAYINGIKY